MTQKTAYCRLFVILAREAHKAIIFRRGPSNWVRLIVWNTDNDTFEYGQWFKGRVYEEKCDLSPDGTKLIYFAAKHYKGFDYNAEYKNNWTAISKPPYFTALAMWPQITTYGGGGLFEDNNTIHLNGSNEPHENHIPPAWFHIMEGIEGNWRLTWANLFWGRLERDGWIVIQRTHFGYDGWGSTYDTFEVHKLMQKRHPNRLYTINMNLVEVQRYTPIFEHFLKDEKTQTKIPISTDKWADWDHQGRLAYTNEGKLYVSQIINLKIEPQMIADFNDQKPKAIIAPEWAKTW